MQKEMGCRSFLFFACGVGISPLNMWVVGIDKIFVEICARKVEMWY